MRDDTHTIALQELVELVNQGKKASPEVIDQVRSLLTNYQAKIDTIQVGITSHQMSRLPNMATRITDLEVSLFGEEGENLELMQDSDKVSLYKALLTEQRNTIGHIRDQATKPTISSPDTMKNSTDPEPEELIEGALPPASRQKVINLMERLKSRGIIDVITDDKTGSDPK